MHIAAGRGNDAVVGMLLTKGVTPDPLDDQGLSPLHHATTFGHGAVAKKLLAAGADVDRGEPRPIAIAAANGDIALAGVLFEHGADLSSPATNGITPLVEAIQGGHAAMVTWLLDTGAELVRRANGLSLLSLAGNLDVTKLLLDLGFEPMERGSLEVTALQSQSHWGRTDVMELLIVEGAEVNASDRYGVTPLLAASQNAKKAAILFLLENGADGTVRDRLGRTPLYYMAWLDEPEVAATLIAAGSDVNARGQARDDRSAPGRRVRESRARRAAHRQRRDARRSRQRGPHTFEVRYRRRPRGRGAASTR